MTKEEIHSEWVGMPEFIQEKQEPYKKLIIRFRNEPDYDDFAQKIGQNLTPKTKSIWHPKLERGLNRGMEYVQGDN